MVETLAEIGSHNLTLMSVFFVWKQRHVYKVLNTYEDEIITGFVNTGEWHQIFERSCHTFPLAYSALFFIYVWVEPLLKRKKFKWQKEDYYWGHLFQMNLLLNDVSKQKLCPVALHANQTISACFWAKIRITLVWKKSKPKKKVLIDN